MNRQQAWLRRIVCALLALTASGTEAQTHDGLAPASDRRTLFNQRVPMRDGVSLVADVYLPGRTGRFPIILVRTPYDRSTSSYTADGEYFSAHGYAVVIQDVRGRGDSPGEFNAFFQEDVDGYDTVEWAARQDWSDGKVGMMGVSYDGFVEWAAAKLRPPHLVTLVSSAAPGRVFREYYYNYGAVTLYPLQWYMAVSEKTMKDPFYAHSIDWRAVFNHLPLATMDEAAGLTSRLWKEYLEHSSLDDYWKRIDLTGRFASIDIPVLHITGWFDWDLPGQMFYYKGMAAVSPAHDRQWLLVGPWTHGGTRNPLPKVGELEFDKDVLVDIKALHVRWFDHWLKDRQNGIDAEPRVNYYSLGEDKWHASATWPPASVQPQIWYLHSDGTANTLAGSGTLSRQLPQEENHDRYIYNPQFPVPTSLDAWAERANTSMNAFDQRFAERRDDVVCYTTAPLRERVTIAGSIKLVLYAASDARDTDFMAKLIDVYPDERAMMMGPGVGVIRARFRDSLSEPSLLVPGKIYRYEIDLNDLAHVFLPGHRIRIEVSSSNFPLYDRNPNTGAAAGNATDLRLARQSIYHDRKRPSQLVLPIVTVSQEPVSQPLH
jgi:uncharacterized protein